MINSTNSPAAEDLSETIIFETTLELENIHQNFYNNDKKSENKVIHEIHLSKGIFSFKSEVTKKFSVSISYKEQVSAGKLPVYAPEDYKKAIPDIYYVSKDGQLISYSVLYKEIEQEKLRMLDGHDQVTDEFKKQVMLLSSKKVLKEYGVSDETVLIYSPVLSYLLLPNDKDKVIGSTFDFDKKIVYVVKELLNPNPETKRLQMKPIISDNSQKPEDYENDKIINSILSITSNNDISLTMTSDGFSSLK
jgi:hypothetical protein